MSASYVRDKTRTWCNEVSTATTVPFYDSINVEINPTDDVWFSVAFGADYNEGTFCDRGFMELGFVRVVVVAAPGTGDVEAISAMERIIPGLLGKVDPSGRLTYEGYEPLNEASGGSADADYRVEVVLNCRHTL